MRLASWSACKVPFHPSVTSRNQFEAVTREHDQIQNNRPSGHAGALHAHFFDSRIIKKKLTELSKGITLKL